MNHSTAHLHMGVNRLCLSLCRTLAKSRLFSLAGRLIGDHSQLLSRTSTSNLSVNLSPTNLRFWPSPGPYCGTQCTKITNPVAAPFIQLRLGALSQFHRCHALCKNLKVNGHKLRIFHAHHTDLRRAAKRDAKTPNVASSCKLPRTIRSSRIILPLDFSVRCVILCDTCLTTRPHYDST